MIFSTCENIGDIFETLRQRFKTRFLQNCRVRQIGRLRVNFTLIFESFLRDSADLHTRRLS